MRTVFSEIIHQRIHGRDLCLALIISGDGSAPRKTGSMMLVGEEGRITGTVGGGAVEFLSERLGRESIEKKSSFVHPYRLHPNREEDIGMICGGNVDILFQFIPASEPEWDAAAEAVLSLLKRQGGSILFDSDGGAPCVLDREGRSAAGTVPDHILFELPIDSAENAFLFGGGHITEYSEPERFPLADQVICCEFTEMFSRIDFGPDDYAAVMTNGHVHDFDALLQLLSRPPAAYIGSIGSRKKVAAVNEKLKQAGIPEERIASVHSPIGTPIKAVTPEEIAVSIAGEMILARAEHREKAGKGWRFGGRERWLSPCSLACPASAPHQDRSPV